MKFKHYLIVFIATFGMSFFMASCLNDDNKIPPNCYDNIKNNDEEDIDCGGSCKECDHCNNGIWEPDKGETWVDCGGSCPVCPQCANGVKDGNEVGIDCGGSCGGCELLCDDGLKNGLEDQIDCQYDVAGVPESCPHCPTCTDGIMNGNETGIDCGGGGSCPNCCGNSSGNCSNGVPDGFEFWTDCGGSSCVNCPDTIYWKAGTVSTYHAMNVATSNVTQTAEQITVNIGPSNLAGTLVLTFKKSLTAGQLWALNGTNAVLTYTDASGTYTSNATSTGNVVLTKCPTTASTSEGKNPMTVVNNPLQGCNKPAGVYTFYRVDFGGKLYHTTNSALSIDISSGVFQFTFIQ